MYKVAGSLPTGIPSTLSILAKHIGTGVNYMACQYTNIYVHYFAAKIKMEMSFIKTLLYFIAKCYETINLHTLKSDFLFLKSFIKI